MIPHSRSFVRIGKVGAVLIVVTMIAAAPRAQVQAPRRDSASTPVGTATLTGVVATNEPTPRPLRRVKVTLMSGQINTPRGTVTDDNGVYAFTNLAAGNYTVVASRSGYVDAAYGARRVGPGPGVPIAVVEGQTLTGVDVRLTRGGVITGTVRSPAGRPVQNFQVQVVPRSGFSLELAATRSSMSTTDDRGVYRVFGLTPGEYLVTARPPGASSEMRAVSAAEISWAQAAATPPTVPGAISTPGPAPAQLQTTTYAPVFHPGTPDLAGATVVTVAAGEERGGINLTTLLVPTARVAGTLADGDGKPAVNSTVTLQRLDVAEVLGPFATARITARTNPLGQFFATGVAPGRYRVMARANPRPAARPPTAAGATPAAPVSMVEMAMSMVAEMLPGAGGAFWAQEDVVVNGRDVSGIDLRLQPGMNVAGRLVFDGATTPAPADVVRARVMFANLADNASIGDVGSMLSGLALVTVNEDGTFEAKGVLPNQYRVQLVAPGLMMPGLMSAATSSAGWTMKSAMLDGRDVADTAFEVRPGEDVKGIVVTMTDRATEIAGRVIDAAGRPAPGFPIVVFSTDKRYWTFGSRRIQQARPASDGRYRLSGLPAGEYFVCAVIDVNQQELYTPAFLETLVPGAFKITLGDGEHKTQDLKLGGG